MGERGSFGLFVCLLVGCWFFGGGLIGKEGGLRKGMGWDGMKRRGFSPVGAEGPRGGGGGGFSGKEDGEWSFDFGLRVIFINEILVGIV